jgi:hypothetical protein
VPFKSEAQRRKFYAMAERGEMPKSKVREYENATRGSLPERVGDREREESKNAKRLAKKRARKAMMRKNQEAN